MLFTVVFPCYQKYGFSVLLILSNTLFSYSIPLLVISIINTPSWEICVFVFRV